MILLWTFVLKDLSVSDEWVVESTDEPYFVAETGRTVIYGIGLCNDAVVKDAYEKYDPCYLNGVVIIEDRSGTIVWEKSATDLLISTLCIEEIEGLVEEPIELIEGEIYSLVLLDSNGEDIEGITWSFYGEERNADFLFFFLVVGLCFLFSILYFQYMGLLQISFSAFWCLLLIGFSVISMFVMPPTCVPDENLHFSSSYAVSNQILQLILGLKGLSEEVPLGVLRMVNYGDAQYLVHFWSDWGYGNTLVAKAAEYVLAESMPHYSYVVPAIGITLMRLLHAPYQLYIIAARLMNVAMYASITLLAIKICPSMRPVVMAVSFIPSSLWLINSCSYDVWNLAFCILYVCYIKRLEGMEKVRFRDIEIAVAILSVFLPIKFVYFNFAILVCFIPKNRIGIRSRKVYTCLIVFVLMQCLIIVMLSRGDEVLGFLIRGYDTRAGLTDDTTYSLSWVIKHPVTTILIFVKTMLSSGDLILKMFIGEIYYYSIPKIIRWAIITLFVIICIGTFGNEKDRITVRERLSSMAVIITGVLIIMGAFLLVFTYKSETGIDIIAGLQGRYFLPFLICLVFVVPGSRWVARHLKQAEYALILCSMISILTRFCAVMNGYM